MDDPSLAAMRRDYRGQPLDEKAVPVEPIAQFERWFEDARRAQVPEPNAMTLATVGPDGRPAARTLLLKSVDRRGFSFFTNLDSRKSAELRAEPRAAMVFWWGPLARQVRIEGVVEPVEDAEADAYFGTRPRGSQLGAWASPQSAVIGDRAVLTAAVEAQAARFAEGEVPRPPFWGGYRLRPERVEFWQGQADRLHDRICYTREQGGAWRIERLAP